ncbi:glycosyltransferase family 2 protein [Chloroflexota bacterium]
MKHEPTVSVIIPTYNRAHLIGRAIQSVLNQTYQDFEIVIIDDGSTDNTEEVVKGFSYDRLRHIQLSEKPGQCVARNTGLKAAKGEYIAVLDDDDSWLDEEKLKKQIEFLDAHPDYVLVGTNSVVVDGNGSELARGSLPEKDDEIRGKLLEQNCFVHSSVMYRKSAVMIFGGYSPVKGTPNCNDYELWLQLGTVGKFANLPIYGVNYTIWSGNISIWLGNISAKNLLTLRLNDLKLTSKYKNEYPNYRRAINSRYVAVFNALFHVISDLPPFSGLKRFLKSRCPACWQAIKFSHEVTLQSIPYILNKLHKG